MANTERRYRDKNGNTFIPMNVDGGSWNENFMTTTKMVALCLMVAAAFILVVWLKDIAAAPLLWGVMLFLYFIVAQYALRYIVFEEKYYYEMYKQRKVSEITTPSIFWNIASVKNTETGAILVYSDAKVGILIRLERDTITGKESDFMEQHYDALSNFYKELNTKMYSFVQCNLMEPAGKDPRLPELDKLINRSSNKNIVKLIEMMVGHIRNKTRRTLFETDYVLVYTPDMSRTDVIISDTVDCIFKVLDGAFIGYNILDGNGIIEMVKEQYGIKYFDYADATLAMFRANGVVTESAFKLSRIEFSNGDSQEIGNLELNKITSMTSGVSGEAPKITSGAIRKAVFSNTVKEIDFDGLSESLLDPDYDSESGMYTGNKGKGKMGMKLGKKDKKRSRHAADIDDNELAEQQYLMDMNIGVNMLDPDDEDMDI